MRISFTANAVATSQNSRNPVRVPESIDGWKLEDDRLENYLDARLADQGVVGGEIHLVVRDGVARIIVDYWSPADLNDFDTAALKDFTVGQLSDGIGENGFQLSVGQGAILVMPDLDTPCSVERVDDGREILSPPKIAVAARAGDLPTLRIALQERKEQRDVDEILQGYTGLHLAILYGNTDAALLLIDSGSNPNMMDHFGDTALDLCALSNSLTDEDCKRLAESLLEHGADIAHIGSTGKSAVALAALRGKRKMEEVLIEGH